MSWMWVSLSAYFLLSLSAILDKLLLKKRISKPSVYAFYVAIMSILAFVLVFFYQLHYPSARLLFWSLLSGFIFVYGMLGLFYAIRKNEISRVNPLFTACIQVFAFLFAAIFLKESFDGKDILGVALLVAGGFFISFDLPIKSLKIFSGFRATLVGGFLTACSYGIYDYVYVIYESLYQGEGFVNGFVWTRLGSFLAGLSLLLIPKFRTEILKTFHHSEAGDKHEKKRKRRRKWLTVFLFLINKISTSVASILTNYAFYLGSVAYVQAVGSIQFVFVLIMAHLAAVKRPDIFEEKLYFWDWVQKIVSIAIIGSGLVLISL